MELAAGGQVMTSELSGSGHGDVQQGSSSDDERCDTQRAPLDRLIETADAEAFDRWYQEREFANNIRQGTPYFNGPSNVSTPERHSPSKLLQCHRKSVYNRLNAPEETEDPDGIFWIGSRVEENIVLPFLRQAVAGEEEYVTNSIWVDFTVGTEAGELRIKGETDPVIVDADAAPILPTEIKTKSSVSDVESPNTHHRAQIHAYLKGLSEKHEQNITKALVIYVGRTDLDICIFEVTFDPVFWTRTVVRWAREQTTYRLNEELPPAEPEQYWECSFCAYQKRCGKGESEFADIGAVGLLPSVREYPKQKVIEYLQAQDSAKLTPSLAHQYPELHRTHEFEVHDWECRACGGTYPWDSIDWNPEATDLPRCPGCSDSEPVHLLSGPPPDEQGPTKLTEEATSSRPDTRRDSFDEH